MSNQLHRGTRSILPNSSNSLLTFDVGGFAIRWHEEKDTHTLYHEGDPIVSKHNGFSCKCLAERILSGNLQRALDQFDYIKKCGGEQHVLQNRIRELMI